MLDLPDHGYTSYSLRMIDPGGVAPGSLGGPDDVIPRMGIRYAVTFNLKPLRTADEARVFQMMLERAARDDVSYPWPLDMKARPAGSPLVNGSSPAGAVIPLKSVTPYYSFKEGQPLAVRTADGLGEIHKVTAPTMAAADGTVILPVHPWTRSTFADNAIVEVEKPRIRGVLIWGGSDQNAIAYRPFSFTVQERE